MKLLIKETCVVGGGKIAERGETYDTKWDGDPKEDKEAYQLISSGRAIEANDPDADKVLSEVATEKRSKAQQKADAVKK